ncbi:unnamed protein product, partial [Symbiodinium sp. CCMP2456]
MCLLGHRFIASPWQLGVDAKDGQAELGIEAAQELGVCALDGHEMRWRNQRYVYAITQFRGMLYLPASDETVLAPRSDQSMFGHWCSPQAVSYVQRLLRCEVKGNLCIDPLLGKKMRLPFASIKARKQGKRDDLGYGIDVVRTTTRPMKTPGLSYFVLAMLQLRVACVEDEQQRRDVEKKLE